MKVGLLPLLQDPIYQRPAEGMFVVWISMANSSCGYMVSLTEGCRAALRWAHRPEDLSCAPHQNNWKRMPSSFTICFVHLL